jgi:GDP-4-dehydro-6-deoxy-D-mannose reductase
MRVLLTGAGGFVGRYVLAELAGRGHETIGAGLESRAPAHLARAPGLLRWERWDVTAEDAVQRGRALLRGTDAVLHLAGQASAARSFDDPRGTMRANFDGTVALLEAARAIEYAGALLVVGSSEAYGRIAEGVPCGEDTALAPVSPYGVSKAAADLAARAWAKAYGLRAFVARAFSHTGAGQSPAFALASWAAQIAAFEAGAAAGDSGPFRLRVGNLAPVRDYSDVRDVARAYALLLAAGEAGQAYNVASGEGRTLASIVQALAARSRVRVEVVEDPARLRPADVPYLVGDPSRLERATGHRPGHAFENTLEHLLDGARRAREARGEGGP